MIILLIFAILPLLNGQLDFLHPTAGDKRCVFRSGAQGSDLLLRPISQIRHSSRDTFKNPE
jgi:hypothetical protein